VLLFRPPVTPPSVWASQVGRKAQALVQLLGQHGGGAAGSHSMLVLANRIVAQCEVQARTHPPA
jgi:hypothetical protein